MNVTTTPIAGQNHAWRMLEFRELHPLVRRSLASIFGLRNPDGPPVSLFSDLCLCQVEHPLNLQTALDWAEEHCGARIPVAVYPGPPARILISIRDAGAFAAWYFRSVEKLHGV